MLAQAAVGCFAMPTMNRALVLTAALAGLVTCLGHAGAMRAQQLAVLP